MATSKQELGEWGERPRRRTFPAGDFESHAPSCPVRTFAHFRFLTSGGFNNEHQLARNLHSLGGGWEAVAGGLLTLTIPCTSAGELQRMMEEERLAPGVISLET